MSDAIKVAIITGGLSIFGIVLSSILQMISTSNKIKEEFQKQTAEIQKQSEIDDLKLQAKLENFQAVTNEKIDELSRRVESHNKIVERTYQLEQKVQVQEERQRTANHRIEDLERMGTH